jgi:hypothetical protein
MFDTVLEGVMSDGVVKIKGLGTFKLVDVGQRESVSVSTGERLLIPGYKKVNFIPEETLNELIGKDFISADEYHEDDSDVEKEEGAYAGSAVRTCRDSTRTSWHD